MSGGVLSMLGMRVYHIVVPVRPGLAACRRGGGSETADNGTRQRGSGREAVAAGLWQRGGVVARQRHRDNSKVVSPR